MANPRPSPVRADRGSQSVSLAAVTLALVGLALVALVMAQPRVRSGVVGQTVKAGGLGLSVESADWVGHDMSSMGPMPMEGMPEAGNGRIHVKVLVSNGGQTQTEVAASDFRLVAPGGKTWPAQRTTIHGSRLSAGQSVMGDLYFEVPSDQADYRLTLSRGRDQALVPLALPGSPHAEGGTH